MHEKPNINSIDNYFYCVRMYQMTTQDDNTITLHFTPESMRQLSDLARKYKTTIPQIITKALALFQVAQNKKIVLKTEIASESLEISNFYTNNA